MTTTPTASTFSPRQIVRGATASFDDLWRELDGTPIVMADPAAYPAYAIVLPDETILTSGTAANLGGGRYRVSVFIPADAPLTSPDRPWRIQWTVLTPTGQTQERSYGFEVIDAVEGDPTERAQTYLTMRNDTERVMIRFFTEQQEVSVQLRNAAGCVEEEATVDAAGAGGAPIQVVHEKGTVLYYYDTTPAEQPGMYQVVWKTRQTTVSPALRTVQALRVVPDVFWDFEPSLRMLIDKFQKRVGLPYAYSTADLYEYMVRGFGYVNSIQPMTSWSMSGFPAGQGFDNYFLLAAGWWAMQAQYLNEAESMFSFSGSPVTLDVDRTGAYESAGSRMKEVLDTNVPKAKSAWLRRMSPGTLATRPYDFSISNTVFRAAEGRGLLTANFPAFIGTLGIF